MTREQWLNDLAGRFRPWFVEANAPVPDTLRVSVGWPSRRALSAKKRTIGQCWAPECSTDKHTEIFVSPFLGEAYAAAETLLHELVHAAVGCAAGHKGAFIACAKKLGFTAPWKSTPASEDLKARLQGLLKEMPAYPHATLDATAVERLTKKEGTRLVKCQCAKCGYVVRTTRKWLDEVGAPLCACSGEPMEAEVKEDQDGERKAA